MSEFTAKKLKEARMKAGFTQDEAADLMKTTKSAYCEAKRPDLRSKTVAFRF